MALTDKQETAFATWRTENDSKIKLKMKQIDEIKALSRLKKRISLYWKRINDGVDFTRWYAS